MTPDKIYIPGKWLHVPNNHFETEPSYKATEYIRKDRVLNILKEAEHLADAALKIDKL
jgi:hypothetical protein